MNKLDDVARISRPGTAHDAALPPSPVQVEALGGAKKIVLRLDKLDEHADPAGFECFRDTLITEAQKGPVALDISKTKHMTMAALGVCISADNLLLRRGQRLIVIGPTPDIATVLAITGLAKRFEVKTS